MTELAEPLISGGRPVRVIDQLIGSWTLPSLSSRVRGSRPGAADATAPGTFVDTFGGDGRVAAIERDKYT